MIKGMKTFFQSIYQECEKNKLRFFILVATFLLFFAYCLSIPAFSNIHPFNYLSIGICGLMCISMLIYTFLYSKIKINLLIGLLFVFNVCILLTHLINHSFFEMPKTIALMSIVAFCIYQFGCSIKRKELLFLLVLVAGILFSLIYIVYFRSRLIDFSNLLDGKIGDPFDNPNEIAKEFSFFALIAFAFIFKSKKISLKILCLIITIVFLFLIMTTGSISALLSTIVAGIVCSIIFEKTIKGKIIIAGAVVVTVTLFVLLLQLPQLSYFKDRIDSIFNTLISFGKDAEDGSSLNRFQALLTTFKIGFTKPVFGYGYMASTSFNNLNIQAHNNYIELFLDFGMLGLFLYESIVLLPIIYSKKHKNRELVLSTAIFMLVFQLFLTTYYKKYEYIFFALGFAVLDDAFDFSYVVHNSSIFRRNRQKKCIVEIIPSLSPVGGAETFITDFIIDAKSRYSSEIDIVLIILYEQVDSNLLKTLNEKGVTIYQLHKHKGFDLKCAFKLRDIVLDYYPEVVHSHLLSIRTLKTAFLFKRKRIKFYHTIHHNYSGSKSDKFLIKLIKKHYLNPVCVAETPSKEYSKVCGLSIAYINNGIDKNKFDNTVPLGDRKIDYLVVGRFVQIKNHLRLLEIINEYFKDEKYNFTFLGDGELLSECKRYCRINKLGEIVTFKGSVNNVAKYMSNSRVLVMPSLNEGNPIVINEAIASGMAIIGNDVGGIHDLLIDNKWGFLVDVNDKQKFASTMKKIIKNIEDKKIRLINHNRDKISISNCVDNYLKLFEVI